MTAPKATAEQLAALMVPATLPGVVRCGTPVREAPHCGPAPLHGIALHDQSFPSVDVFWLSDDERVNVGFDDVVVDLTDATGRAHVTWACLQSLDKCSGSFRYSAGRKLPDAAHPAAFGWWRYGAAVWRAVFADLDPNDDTRLPDGSRWVDAEALRLVALHILGGAS